MIIIYQIYLDNAATSPLSSKVKEYIISILDNFYNPSSTYQHGQEVRKIITDARQSVAKFINANANDIYFTSGGSASNTLAIKGYYQQNDCTIFYSPIAHKSILKCVESYHNSIPLKVNKEGIIDVHDLEKNIDVCINTPLVVIDHANNEIGTIQNIDQIIKITHLHNGIVYLDCTGSIPTIQIDVKKIDVDMIGFSAHKLGGLKGCGVLYKKKDIVLEPLIYGSQEKGLFGGTENVLGIASLGKAIEEYDYSSISSANRDYVYNYMVKNIPDSYLIGSPIDSDNRLPHNLYMCFPKCESESLMILLDMNGVCVSVGSACSSGELSPSPTLVAIGMDEQDIHSCIRMTFGLETQDEINYVCETLKQCVENLRNFNM